MTATDETPREQPETSGATTALLLRYARAQAGARGVARILAESGLPHSVDELENRQLWFSYATRTALLEAMVSVLGDPEAALRAGRSTAEHGVDHARLLMLRTFASPRPVYRMMPHAVHDFSTVVTLEVLATTRTSATLRMRLKDGYTPHRLDCDLSRGFFASMPVMLGLPLATVVHDECQCDGFAACTYVVSWVRRRARRCRRGSSLAVDLELSALRGQLRDLQLTASDLVASDDVETVLDRIIDGASSVVSATTFVLLVEAEEDAGDGPSLRTHGTPGAALDALVAAVRNGDPLGISATVVELVSTRGRRGLLAAARPPDVLMTDDDRTLLIAYARHAAAALDLVGALETSRRETARATALLTLAQDLTAAHDADAVAQVAAVALPRITGSRSSSLLLWNSAEGILRAAASSGHTDAERSALLAKEIRADVTPELVELLTRRQPMHIDSAVASPDLADLIGAVGARAVTTVPLVAGDELMGVVTVGWERELTPRRRHEALARVSGVADQVATALQNARLLATVEHQSLHDALTGLPNRALFNRLLEKELSSTTSDLGTAVLFCDLDRFKQVNDRWGHAAGDEVLRQVARLLASQIGAADTLARLGGDEFGIILRATDDVREALAVAHRLVDSLDRPLRIDGRELRVTSSIGISLHAGPEGRADRVLGAADSAMYVAKQRGRDQVAVAGESEPLQPAPSLEGELRRAVAGHQLRLHFQPVVDVSVAGDNIVLGAEALLRWEHPRLGLLAPGSFLPLAEECGLITELDLWALDAACLALAGWDPLPEASSHGPLRVAVNLAADTLVDARLVPAVRAALTHNGLAPEQLHLELVESRSLTDVAGVVERLAELRQMGVRISLDDFGTGFSTLAWLQALPVDQIKIDRSFVMALEEGGSVALVRGVVALAQELHIEVIAEGVEEPHQLEMLRDAGCRMVQGFLLGRPLPGFVGTVDPALRR